MLVLFETAAGYAVFKLLDEKKLQKSENLYLDFQSPESANKVVKLKQFHKFADTTEALAAATASVEGKMTKSLKSMLKKLVVKEAQQELAVADAKLGNVIKDKLDIQCVYNSNIHELMRGIRSQVDGLITGLPQKELSAMSLGLAHSLSRYKLKFSPDKVDTMIVQAISLLDDLDKEVNNYVMRAKEWYGWHFPELSKIVSDYTAYAKLVQLIGDRTNAVNVDMSDILTEELEQEVKKLAEISMGTEVSEDDIVNINFLCGQIVEISEYRTMLYDYLKNRMMAIAPNLTVLVGELVGARLIAHAGSLMNLAKHPASTVQILGAEKALFRALKTHKDTPKYGLIYHASLVSQANTRIKGKMSRMLAAKAALACRHDALADTSCPDIGIEHRATLEVRLKQLEEQKSRRISGTGRQKPQFDVYTNKSEIRTYDRSQDSTLGRKRKIEEISDTPTTPKTPAGSETKKKKKKSIATDDDGEEHELLDVSQIKTESKTPKSDKKKKKKSLSTDDDVIDSGVLTPKSEPKSPKSEPQTPKSDKKKKKKSVSAEEGEISEFKQETPKSGKKKKKKSISSGDGEISNGDIDFECITPKSEPQTPKSGKKKRKSGGIEEDVKSVDDETPGKKLKKKKSDKSEHLMTPEGDGSSKKRKKKDAV